MTSLTPAYKTILSNERLLALSEDPLQAPARRQLVTTRKYFAPQQWL